MNCNRFCVLQLPRHTLLLEEELEDLVVSHLHHNPHTFCHCPGEEGPGGAPRYCRLGLPLNNTAGSVATGSGGGRSEERGDGELGEASWNGGATQQKDREQTQQEQQARRESEGAGAAAQHGADAAVMASALQQQPPHAAQQEHRLAVLIPYRDRQQHLEALLAALRPFLDHQSRAHDVFVVEQASCLPCWSASAPGASVQLSCLMLPAMRAHCALGKLQPGCFASPPALSFCVGHTRRLQAAAHTVCVLLLQIISCAHPTIIVSSISFYHTCKMQCLAPHCSPTTTFSTVACC